MSVKIHESWKKKLEREFKQPYFQAIKSFLIQEKKNNTILYPKGKDIFNAYNTTPFENVKVVILGQDPYHGEGQAHGLSFSVQKGIKPPPSLKNIFKEIKSDLDIAPPNHGELTHWAEQGVLLLNAILTVRAKQPASHRKIGWEQFTDATIKTLSTEREHLVFLLWGNFAQQKKHLIDESKHLILTAAHPSPFSAHRGFFGCQHFSKTNTYLVETGQNAIDWQIPE